MYDDTLHYFFNQLSHFINELNSDDSKPARTKGDEAVKEGINAETQSTQRKTKR